MNNTGVTDKQLTQMLRSFIDGTDRSLDAAGRLEVALDEEFPDDDEVADVVLALASYRPGGGEYLYDEHQIVKLCEWVLNKLNNPAPE